MSTRTNVLIECGDTKLWLYRHHDGYLSETGYNLASILANSDCYDTFICSLLEQKYDASICRNSEKIYEFSTGQHGDIEYLYSIKFIGKEVKFKAEHVASWEERKTLLDTDYFELSNEEVRKQLNFIIQEQEEAHKRFYKTA